MVEALDIQPSSQQVTDAADLILERITEIVGEEGRLKRVVSLLEGNDPDQE